MTKITHKRLKSIIHYSPETGLFHWTAPRPKIRVGQQAGHTRKGKNYVEIEIDGQYYAAHRLAWFYVTGEWPTKQIDHRDKIKNNNRFSNLREATNGQNMANSPQRNINGFKGVKFCKWLKAKPYQAQITINKKCYYLGCYATPQEAHAAYCKAAKRAHGEFFSP